ncbi:MAG: TIGR01906 family membrane protein [Clostridia bacterium]|nr:TIGR01906 family membrane protein [Clostridia bacterium]
MIKKILIALPLALAMLILSIAMGLGIIHLTNFIYYIDIEVLDIPANSGFSRDTILENYHAMMEYLSPFSGGEFHLPSMAYSESGAFHFEECKVIFNRLYLWGAVSFVFVSLMAVFYRDKFTYRLAGILTLVLPTVTGIGIAVDFERAFVIFHKLLFDNMDWIFDPRYDEVILILPSEFFMHCGIFIALCVVAGAVLLMLFGGFKSVRRKND